MTDFGDILEAGAAKALFGGRTFRGSTNQLDHFVTGLKGMVDGHDRDKAAYDLRRATIGGQNGFLSGIAGLGGTAGMIWHAGEQAEGDIKRVGRTEDAGSQIDIALASLGAFQGRMGNAGFGGSQYGRGSAGYQQIVSMRGQPPQQQGGLFGGLFGGGSSHSTGGHHSTGGGGISSADPSSWSRQNSGFGGIYNDSWGTNIAGGAMNIAASPFLTIKSLFTPEADLVKNAAIRPVYGASQIIGGAAAGVYSVPRSALSFLGGSSVGWTSDHYKDSSQELSLYTNGAANLSPQQTKMAYAAMQWPDSLANYEKQSDSLRSPTALNRIGNFLDPRRLFDSTQRQSNHVDHFNETVEQLSKRFVSSQGQDDRIVDLIVANAQNPALTTMIAGRIARETSADVAQFALSKAGDQLGTSQASQGQTVAYTANGAGANIQTQGEFVLDPSGMDLVEKSEWNRTYAHVAQKMQSGATMDVETKAALKTFADALKMDGNAFTQPDTLGDGGKAALQSAITKLEAYANLDIRDVQGASAPAAVAAEEDVEKQAMV